MANRDPVLQKCFATAARRMRLQRMAHTTGWLLKINAGLLALFLFGVLVHPGLSAGGLIFLVALLGLFGIAWLISWGAPIKNSALLQAIDRHFDLPDHVLTAGELGSEEAKPWLMLQYADTARRLAGRDWKMEWPITWPRLSPVFAFAGVALAILVLARFATYLPPVKAVGTTASNQSVATIEEVFKDWEKAAEKTDDPELKKLVAEIQPLREEMPKMSERELMLALSKLENKLQARKDAAAKESLEEAAGDLASALENMDEMGALAAALRRKDFEKAAEMSQAKGEKLSESGAKTPRGADSASAQQQMQQASEKLAKSGQTSASEAMQQVQQGGQKNDAKSMGQGMKNLGQSFGKEAKRQSALASLGTQLAQLGECKAQLGQKPGEGQGKDGAGISTMPKLADGKQPGGHGAGTESDPNHTKDPTKLDSSRVAQNLSGKQGEGESQQETLQSDTPSGEAPRGEKSAQFAQYEKLSQQAISDESLPLAYREAIRKYFEAIRPSNDK